MAITSPIDQATAPEAAEPNRRARWMAAIRDFARHRTLGAVGAAVVLLMLVLAVFAGGLAPYDPVAVDFGAMLAAPNATHWLGTDAFGRDVLSRLIYGSRAALVIRSSALTIREMPYVDAARAAGFGHVRIILRHMLPNVVASYLIMLTAFLSQAILAEASLSFLGLGVQEPTPAWGLMLRGAAVDFAEAAPWMALFPGLSISLAVFAFNLFGDSLRDALDPKLRLP